MALASKLGSILGGGIGQGIGSHLQGRLDELAMDRANRLGEAQRLKKRSYFEGIGFTPEQADFIMQLRPQEQWQAAQLLGMQQQVPQDIEQSGMQALEMKQPQREIPQEVQSILQTLGNAQVPEQALMALMDPAQQKELVRQQFMGSPSSVEAKPKVPVRSPERPKPPIKTEPAKEVAQGQASLFGSLGGETPAQKFQREKFEKQQTAAEEKRIASETLPTYKEITKAAHAAERNNVRLDKMNKLIQKGDLPYAATYRAFKSLAEDPVPVPVVGPLIGLITHSIGGVGQSIQRALTATDTEEFEKLSNDFLRDAKDVFGSRITDADLKAFLQMVPTLSQTDNGKKAIINNMREFNDLAIARNEIMTKIIKENGGRRPANLDILVDERLAPQLNKLSNDMKLMTRSL